MREDCGSAKHGTIRISAFDPNIMTLNQNENKDVRGRYDMSLKHKNKKNGKYGSDHKSTDKMSVGSIMAALLISFVWLFSNYYINYPAINVQSTEFWEWLTYNSVIVTLVFIFCGIIGRRDKDGRFAESVRMNVEFFFKRKGRFQIILLFLIPICCILVIVFGNLAGAPLFHAKRYASLLTVDNRDFVTDILESENVDNIALMDTNSARIFGDRKIGSLSDVVSQFEVEDAYTQINIDNKPMKVANLKYADFFKYLSNKSDGIPGYITVNPVDSTAKYVKLDKGMKYVPSGYFNDKIMRHVQMNHPTKIFEGCYFEVMDDGTPCYICPVLHARIGLFGGMDVKGAVICDPVTGDMQYYDVADIPTWVDRVYDGELLEKKYNWYGKYSKGYWNSIVGQKGCVQTTDDYGYKTIEDDVWIYTGVTSVTGDINTVLSSSFISSTLILYVMISLPCNILTNNASVSSQVVHSLDVTNIILCFSFETNLRYLSTLISFM